MTEPRMETVDLDGRQITTSTWGDGTPEIIMLHDGLGSIAQWREVPATLAAASDRTVMAYDRAGHGESLPVPSGPWPTNWLHTEAELLARLITAVGADQPVLVGHSDGASIATIHAATTDQAAPIVLLAVHSWLEQAAVDQITLAREQPDDIVPRLGRYHRHAAEMFEAWSGAWVSEGFSTWDIRPMIHSVTCPTLVLQGTEDEYATQAHVALTTDAIGDNAEGRLLDGLRHNLHHDAPELVVDSIVAFIERTLGTDPNVRSQS